MTVHLVRHPLQSWYWRPRIVQNIFGTAVWFLGYGIVSYRRSS